ncbi:zinc ribbon domain-containing protein [Nocardia huaxiensis]|uniref:zinc ribbon domain-containing protein n=1 Tax=Nocardia huaxiensis TaxID=2755382 RepID=UPI001E3F71C4|nr:C4-type zinc ribbon domain-containing protein [Nocardia huaxiensis]UFS99652.1 C4-type zinc ribbon domain-containing protein [Nocardia huaxiensis]
MNAEPSIQSKLLDLAAVDAELTRIEHRRKVLPEEQEVRTLEAERTARKDAAVKVEIIIDDLDRDIRKLEGEIDAVAKREQRDRGLLTAGTVNAKQLSELQHELGSLERRRKVLEDDLIEVMERREAAAADHDHAGANLDRAEQDLVDAERRRDEALADLAVAQQRCDSDRAALTAVFPVDLLAAYDKQRTGYGVGAALLQARRCGACRIELDRGEIARIAKAAPDAVVRCPECNAILVRTKQSGL